MVANAALPPAGRSSSPSRATCSPPPFSPPPGHRKHRRARPAPPDWRRQVDAAQAVVEAARRQLGGHLVDEPVEIWEEAGLLAAMYDGTLSHAAPAHRADDAVRRAGARAQGARRRARHRRALARLHRRCPHAISASRVPARTPPPRPAARAAACTAPHRPARRPALPLARPPTRPARPQLRRRPRRADVDARPRLGHRAPRRARRHAPARIRTRARGGGRERHGSGVDSQYLGVLDDAHAAYFDGLDGAEHPKVKVSAAGTADAAWAMATIESLLNTPGPGSAVRRRR